MQIYGISRRIKPSKNVDGTETQARLSGYGDGYTQLVGGMGMYAMADEGSYFKATNATPGTGIIAATTQSFSATAALFTLSNGDAAGGKRIYMDFVDLAVQGTAPVAATSVQLVITLDNTVRYSSAGTAITPVNANMDDSTVTVATLHFGAVVLSAASGSVRQVSRQVLKTQAAPCMATGDSYFLRFGSIADPAGPLSGSTASIFPSPMSPLIIGGGHSLNFHLYYPAVTTAPTFEFEMGWWER